MPGETSKRELEMVRKRGFIPRRIWNALVDRVYRNRLAQVIGGTLRETSEGLVLDVRPGWRKKREYKPFEGQVIDDATIGIHPGYVAGYTGANPAISYRNNSIYTTRQDVAVSADGSIWIEMEVAWQKIEDIEVVLTDETIHVNTYRAIPESFTGVAAYNVGSEPAAGSTWGVGTTFYIKVLDFEMVEGKPRITDQVLNENLYIAETVTDVV